MVDLRQDSQKTRLAYQQNTLLCALSILKHHVSAEMCLLGHQWISRGFTLAQYLEKGSVPSAYTKPKGSLDTDYPRNEGRFANRFFSRNVFLDVSLGPYRETSASKIPLPQKKIRFLFRLGSIFEICFRSSKMTGSRPCPTGWAYFYAKLKPSNNKLSTAKIDIFRGQRNITGQNALFRNVYRTFLNLRKKSISPVSSLNNVEAG